MARSLQFYVAGLGLKKAFEIHDSQDRPWIVYLKVAPGNFIELFYGGEPATGFSRTTAGFQHLCLQCDDIPRTVGELAARGVPIESAPKRGKDGNTQAWVVDPDGVRIELMEISPESPQAKA